MYDVLEILKYLLPSLVVFATAFFLVTRFLDSDRKRREIESETIQKQKLLELKQSKSKIVTPIRLQAYERIILFLERISPNSLLLRQSRMGVSAKHLQVKLIQSVREEFEHNLSQQLYISPEAWNATCKAKDEIIRLINSAAMSLDDKASSHDLNNKILELSVAFKDLPTKAPIELLKKEIKDIF